MKVRKSLSFQGPASETEDPNDLTLTIPDGAVIPDDAVITDEASLEEALSETPQEMPDTGGVKPGSLEGVRDHLFL